MNRYLFIGSIDYSAHCLKALLKMGVNLVGIMCPHKFVCKFNSDYVDLGFIAKEYKKDIYYFERIKDEVDYVRSRKPDIILVFGLSQIIPKEILDIPTIGCIGSHPALLPRNRGRHPIIWAIANGLTKSGAALFWLDEGVDSGDIWAQKEFSICFDDDSSSIYKKIIDLTVEILKERIPDLEKGKINRIPQDHSKANYWRKRIEKDGEIDWRMSSKRIYDLVRSLAKPYVGAHCILDGKKIKIWKIKILENSSEFDNLEPGKVMNTKRDRIIVKTGDGLIELINHEFRNLPKAGDYL